MSANAPTDICFSFSGLMHRGGRTGPHGDGWGVVFYEDKGCRSFHDTDPSARSEIARFIRGYSIKSRSVICHIRRANRGRMTLENTHPFVRELWGRNWTFAHNGQLRGIKKWPLTWYHPVGTTDSEYAFCWLLDQLRDRWPKMPSFPVLRQAIAALSAQIAEHGVWNMLLSDGRLLYCFRSTHLAVLTRRAPFGKATLVDEDLTADFAQEASLSDVVTIVATRPLTRNEAWSEIAKGRLAVFRDGEMIAGTLQPLAAKNVLPRQARVHG